MEKEKYKLGENNFFECGFLSLSPPHIFGFLLGKIGLNPIGNDK